LVYGLSTHAAQIGRQFLSLRVVFSDPDIQPKQDYVNPQRSLGLQNVEYQKNTVVDHTKKQIEELYQSFTSPQNLEEMEQDKRLISPLFKYQKQALHWMYNHEQFEEDDDVLFWKREGNKWKNQITETTCIQKPNRVRGGILADDMGLGKTIQIISLILKAQQTALPKSNILNDDDDLNEIDPFGFVPKGEAKKNAIDPRVGKIDSNSTLIICPLSLIHNWEDQILTHTIPNSLKVLVYHGPNRTQDPNVIKKFDVVITTYNVIGVGFGKDIVSPLHKIKWYRIVLDEAHIIKSSSTIQAKAAFCFKAQIKWCLT
jgi:SNF2 family DNA or RNA helicase